MTPLPRVLASKMKRWTAGACALIAAVVLGDALSCLGGGPIKQTLGRW
jgi:hypothetical protein